MEFERLDWLWLLIPVVSIILWRLLIFRRQWKSLLAYFGSQQLVNLLPGFSFRRKYLALSSLGIALVFFVLALVNPRVGTERQEIMTETVSVLIAIDLSFSMLAEDRMPNRLEVAKQRAIELIDALPGSRFSILNFAGVAEQHLPFTSDRAAVKMGIRSLEAGTLPLQGTSFEQMLSEAASLLSEAGSGVLVVISDGETHDDQYSTALRLLSENNFPVFTVGIGTEEGSTIPEYISGRKENRRDLDGNLVITRLESETLKEIAFESGGGFLANPSPNAMIQLSDQIKEFSTSGISQGSFRVYRNFYPWLTAIGLIFLLLYRFLSVHRSKSPK
ncbi:MAG: VWA domain-containing protein [Saprospirales bacterium]|nr:MAG: VWA domain-containing protein [Saprospirales bacterium]